MPKETERSRETDSANSKLRPRESLYNPCAARGRGRREEEAAQAPPIARPRPHQGPTQPQLPSKLQAELREVGQLAAGSWVSRASRPGQDRGFRGLREQDPEPGCTRPLSALSRRRALEGWRAPVIFHFLSRAAREDTTRSARSSLTSPLLGVPTPARRAASRFLRLTPPRPPRTPSSASQAAALTQSAQQDGLAPFLCLRTLFVAGPEQGLEPSPSQRSLHLAHGCGPRGAQRTTATGEH